MIAGVLRCAGRAPCRSPPAAPPPPADCGAASTTPACRYAPWLSNAEPIKYFWDWSIRAPPVARNETRSLRLSRTHSDLRVTQEGLRQNPCILQRSIDIDHTQQHAAADAPAAPRSYTARSRDLQLGGRRARCPQPRLHLLHPTATQLFISMYVSSAYVSSALPPGHAACLGRGQGLELVALLLCVHRRCKAQNRGLLGLLILHLC